MTLAWAMLAHRRFVVPRVRAALLGWRPRAAAIPDPLLREAALSALDEKAGNVEAVGVFALLAPRRRRWAALEAIAALQASIDLLDSLEEAGLEPPDDGGYLSGLEAQSRSVAESLPSYPQVSPRLERAIDRCKQGQQRTHAAPRGGADDLRQWACGLGAAPAYRWWEVAAGASSSVAAHALIAAAAHPGTDAGEAVAINAAYFPAIGSLTVLLDDLADREADREAGEHSYLDYYHGSDEAAERLSLLYDRARTGIAGLRRRRLHAAILAGIAAYYLAPPTASGRFAEQARERVLDGGGIRERIAFAAVGAQRRR